MMRSAAAGTPVRRLAPAALAAARRSPPLVRSAPARAAAAVALAFALTVARRAQAEELSLAQALELAAAESPVLAAAESRAEAAVAAARAETRSTRWPRLALASGWTATDTPSAVFGQTLDAGLFTAGDFALDRLNAPDGRAHLGTVVTLELPLDPFGKAAPERRSAAAAAEAAALAAREAVLSVRLRVIEAFSSNVSPNSTCPPGIVYVPAPWLASRSPRRIFPSRTTITPIPTFGLSFCICIRKS